MPSKVLSLQLPKRLSEDESMELEKLCSMLDFVELSLADRFGKAPAQAVSTAQTIVRAYFEDTSNGPQLSVKSSLF